MDRGTNDPFASRCVKIVVFGSQILENSRSFDWIKRQIPKKSSKNLAVKNVAQNVAQNMLKKSYDSTETWYRKVPKKKLSRKRDMDVALSGHVAQKIFFYIFVASCNIMMVV